MSAKKAPRIPLPKSWNKHVRSAMLHVISLAQGDAALGVGFRLGGRCRSLQRLNDLAAFLLALIFLVNLNPLPALVILLFLILRLIVRLFRGGVPAAAKKTNSGVGVVV